MKWSAGIVAVLLLAGCGGGGSGGTDTGGGSSGGSEDQDLLALYQGVKEDVVLNESNQAAYIKQLYIAADAPEHDALLPTVAARARARLLAPHAAMALRRDSREQINERLECITGSGTVSGKLDDNTGVGTLTSQFNDCYQDGIYLSGKQTIKYLRWDLRNMIPLDYIISNDKLRYSLNGDYQELNGKLTVTDQGLCSEVTLENMLYSSNEKTSDVYVDHLTTKDFCNRLDMSGAIYLAKTGKVSISTSENYNVDDVYSNVTQQMYTLPISGYLRLTGKNSSLNIASQKVTPDFSHWEERRTTISLDQDGDGKSDHSYNMPTWYLGVDVLVNYSDSDHDGMWDGWEIFYGSNPNIDDSDMDTDGDGVNSYIEFIAGSSVNYSGDIPWSYENGLYLSIEKPELIYQNVNFTMSISVTGMISPWLKNYKIRDSLMLDMSMLEDVDVTPSANSPCIYNKDSKKLVCENIDLSQFASESSQTLSLGEISITPHSIPNVSLVTTSWHGHMQLPVQTFDLKIYATDASYTIFERTKAWGIESVNGSLVLPTYLVKTGDGIPSKVSIHGKWNNPDLKLNRFESYDNEAWNCDYSGSSFTCDIIPNSAFNLQGGDLIFDKPLDVGNSIIEFSVISYSGDVIKTATSKSLVVVGHDTSAINKAILTAQQQGQLEYSIPDGIYVGAIQKANVDGFTLKGGPNSQLWLYNPQTSDSLSDDGSYFYSINADRLDGLTIYMPSSVAIHAGEVIKNCKIFINGVGTRMYNDDDVRGLIDSPVADGNKIIINNHIESLFVIRQDSRVQNNLIVNNSNRSMLLMTSYLFSNFNVGLFNNTLVGVGSLYGFWVANTNSEFKNNLFVAAGGSKKEFILNEGGYGYKFFDNNIFPVGYSAIGGNNLFTDNPGVDINHDYLLQADSPARDAGVTVDGLGDTDWQGLPRVVGAAPDIGASEYQIAP